MLGLDGNLFIVLEGARWNHHFPVIRTLLFREQADECGIEIKSAGLLQQVCGRTGCEHLARIHRHQPIKARSLFHIGGRDNDAHTQAVVPNPVDQLPELPP